MPDTRKFCASFSVRIGTSRTRFELAQASDYGGPSGFYRVRAGRCWLNGPEGEPLFFDRERLAAMLASAVFGTLPEPSPAPAVPARARVSVRRIIGGEPRHDGGWTLTPPILGANGRWMVAVTLIDGVTFVPVDDCTFERRRMMS